MKFILLSLFGILYRTTFVQCQPNSCFNTNPFSGPYTIFNPRSSGRGHGCKGNCIGVKTVNFYLRDQYIRQPARVLLFNNLTSNTQLDGVCTTFFPLPDDEYTYLVYDSFTYHDGSTQVRSTIATDINPGQILRGNGYYTIKQRFFHFDDNTFAGCEITDYGDSTGHDVFSGSLSSLRFDQLGEVQQLINRHGLAPDGLYVLPNKYPPTCVTQQVCSLSNPYL